MICEYEWSCEVDAHQSYCIENAMFFDRERAVGYTQNIIPTNDILCENWNI